MSAAALCFVAGKTAAAACARNSCSPRRGRLPAALVAVGAVVGRSPEVARLAENGIQVLETTVSSTTDEFVFNAVAHSAGAALGSRWSTRRPSLSQRDTLAARHAVQLITAMRTARPNTHGINLHHSWYSAIRHTAHRQASRRQAVVRSHCAMLRHHQHWQQSHRRCATPGAPAAARGLHLSVAQPSAARAAASWPSPRMLGQAIPADVVPVLADGGSLDLLSLALPALGAVVGG